MTEILLVSNFVLWVAVVALAFVVFALARQIGVLYERISPMGALMMDTGPKVGTSSPVFALKDLDGHAVNLGTPSPRSTLVFFVSPTCPVCKKLLPIVKSASATERRWLSIVLASELGVPAAYDAQLARLNLVNYFRRPPNYIDTVDCRENGTWDLFPNRPSPPWGTFQPG